MAELGRHMARLHLIREQIKAIEEARPESSWPRSGRATW
jgi:hypothetical protein